jgi:hypothetical protein
MGRTAPTRTEASNANHPRKCVCVWCEAGQRVLDAMGEIELGVLEAIRDKQSCAPPIFHPPCLAELARRRLP